MGKPGETGAARADESKPGRRPKADAPTSLARAFRQAMPPQEVRLWLRLRRFRALGLHFRRQVPIGSFIVDFACLKRRIIIELDGDQHGAPEHAARDRRRDAALEAQGFSVLRFWNSAMRDDIDSVVDTILARAQEQADK